MSLRRSTYPTKPQGPNDTPENRRIYRQEVKDWYERVRQEGLTRAESAAEWRANEAARKTIESDKGKLRWPQKAPESTWPPKVDQPWPFPHGPKRRQK